MIFLWISISFAKNFQDIINLIEETEVIKIQNTKLSYIKNKGQFNSSLDKPKFSIVKNNYSKDNFESSSMMSGDKFSLSQNIPIGWKLYFKRKSFESLYSAEKNNKEDKLKRLRAELWFRSIQKEQIEELIKILKENYLWINNQIKVTKKLYRRGKVSQQSLLDLKSLLSEVKRSLVEKKNNLENIYLSISSLVSSSINSLENIPWIYLEQKSQTIDHREKFFNDKITSANFAYKSTRREVIPDINFHVSYTKREKYDDLISVGITIPLPFGGKDTYRKQMALNQVSENTLQLREYLKNKSYKVIKIENTIKEIKSSLDILKFETLKYAQSSRDITAKSYSRGNLDSTNLLTSQLNYLKVKKDIALKVGELRENKVALLLLKGSSLNPGEKK